MCEVLFFAANNTDPDPEKDRRGCWKRGMPVTVKPDGHTWGRLESKAQWIAEGNDPAAWPNQGRIVIVKLPGVPVAKAESLLGPQEEDDAGNPYQELAPDGQGNMVWRPRVFRRCRWRIAIDSIPAAIRTTLLTTGEVTVTPTQIKQYLRRIRDDARFTGLD